MKSKFCIDHIHILHHLANKIICTKLIIRIKQGRHLDKKRKRLLDTTGISLPNRKRSERILRDNYDEDEKACEKALKSS